MMPSEHEAPAPARTSRMKQWISYLLLAAGTVLVFMGTREVLESYLGQSAAAREFAAAAPSPVTTPSSSHTTTPVSIPKPRQPQLGQTIAKLTIPRLATQLYVFEGDRPDDLRRGPGHLADSARPGGRGNCIIAGHRDTHFRALKDIRKGDDILLKTSDGQFLYRVTEMSIVSADDTRPLKPTRDAVLNLITCYPFYYVGNAPKRFVVEAHLAGEVRQ